MREATIWVSETLFYLTNGMMLINTPWIVPWAMFWSVTIVMPLIYATTIRPTSYLVNIPLLIFFALLTTFTFNTAIGPGIVQQQMMMECDNFEIKNTTVMLHGELVDLGPNTVEMCRTKENFYGDFGEWKLLKG